LDNIKSEKGPIWKNPLSQKENDLDLTVAETFCWDLAKIMKIFGL
jgi:hypothetical protein